MKIFSLQSKTSLVVWSLVLGLAITAALYFFSHQQAISSGRDLVTIGPPNSFDYGWPFKFYDVTQYAYGSVPLYQSLNLYSCGLDFVFWIAIIFAILSLIRRFRKN